MTPFYRYFLLIIGLLLSVMSAEALAGKVHVAVAANFTAPAKEIAQAFQKETGHRAVLSFGSTGKLYIQIRNGAPFRVFLAADVERPERLETEGQIVAGTRFTYAQGKLVLYSADPNLIKNSSEILHAGGKFARLAIANPKTAPYGGAAIEIMKKLGVYDQVKHKIVKGDNIAQTYQFVSTQNAQAGFVAVSQVINHDMGSRWMIRDTFYTPIDQQAVLLKNGADDPVAEAFYKFLTGEVARQIIRSYGYGVR